jgi:CheY-like chemotaxis protein
VDDHPKNNSYFIEELARLGVKVHLAQTTSDALSMFGRRRYSAVISDMGRNENGRYNEEAGIDLLKAIRQRDAELPFVFFSSSRAAAEHRDEAMRLKANGITSSPTELYALLHLDQLKDKV